MSKQRLRRKSTGAISAPCSGRRIDDLDLSVRSANCLRNANINTVADLVARSEKEMLETKNFGRKSLEEIQEVLDRMGLSFGMEVPENAETSVQA